MPASESGHPPLTFQMEKGLVISVLGSWSGISKLPKVLDYPPVEHTVKCTVSEAIAIIQCKRYGEIIVDPLLNASRK